MAEADASGSCCVVVRIQDTGQGIPDDVRDADVRAVLYPSKDDGTGLGLYRCQHHGDGMEGQLVSDHRRRAARLSPVRVPIAGEKSDEQEYSFVDDEPNMLAAFEESSVRLDHEVVTARRAEMALDDSSCAFDLVVLDIRLPGMSGLELAPHIKRDHAKVPIIVMTGMAR